MSQSFNKPHYNLINHIRSVMAYHLAIMSEPTLPQQIHGHYLHSKPNGGKPTFKINRRHQLKHGFKAKRQ